MRDARPRREGRLHLLLSEGQSLSAKNGLRAAKDGEKSMSRRVYYRIGKKRGGLRVDELSKHIPQAGAAAFLRDCVALWEASNAEKLQLLETIDALVRVRQELQAIGGNFNQLVQMARRVECLDESTLSISKFEETQGAISDTIKDARKIIRFWKVS